MPSVQAQAEDVAGSASVLRRAGASLADNASERWHWGLPLALLTSLGVLSLVLWRLELWDQRNKVNDVTGIMAQRLALRVQQALSDHVESLSHVRLAYLRQLRGVESDPEACRRVVKSLLQQYPGYDLLGSVNEQGICGAAMDMSGPAPLTGRSLHELPQWSGLLAAAYRSGHSESAAETVHLRVVFPIAPLDPSAAPPGAIIARFNLARLVDQSMRADARTKLVVRLNDDPHVVAGHGAGVAGVEASAPIELLGQTWQLRVQPNKELVSQTMGHSPYWVLGGGLLASVLVAFATFQALEYRASHGRRTQRHLESLESLNDISAAISGRLSSGNEVLTQLAEAARGLLSMDRAGVCIVHPQTGILEILASAGDMPPSFPRFFPLEKTPGIRRCLETNEVLFVEDAGHIPSPVNLEYVSLFRAGSFILLPLTAPGQSAVMTLARNRPGRLTALDRRLAALLGAQAAVILANKRLYEQMSEAIQTRDVLLRELNHRVKNNLAGIVSLLSVGKPALPAEAEAWMDRAIERIRAMSGAHGLFAGATRTVGLRQLFQQVLSSVAVVRPSTVEVRVEAPAEDVQLSSEQAVHVVMVLHELCYNALVHGLCGTGTLTLRARPFDGERNSIELDVIDDGCGLGASGGSSGPFGLSDSSEAKKSAANAVTASALSPLSETAIAPPMAQATQMVQTTQVVQTADEVERPATTGTGLGLELVRGLVTRELRGQFSLSPRPGGGTVASVVFPLASDES